MSNTKCGRKLGLVLIGLMVTAATVILSACGQPTPDKLLASAKESLAKGNASTAVIHLKNLLLQAPDHGEARLLLGQALFDARDYAGAEKELQRALELKQPHEKVIPAYVKALLAVGKNQSVVEIAGKYPLFSPAAVAATRATLGDAQLRLGNRTAAKEAYEAALAAVADYPRARLGIATLLAAEGKLEEALTEVIAIGVAEPKIAEAHHLRSELLLAKGDREAAKKALEDAINADGAYLPARLALVKLLLDERQFDAAAAQIDKARASAPRDLRVAYQAASLAYRRGEIDAARQQIQQVLKFLPDDPQALVLAGAIELRKSQYSAAEAHLRKALARVPSHYGARLLLTQTYLGMGRPEAARDALQPLVQKGVPRNAALLLLAGETYLAAGDTKQAAAFYQAVPENRQIEGAAAKTRLGLIALATGRPDEGLKDLEVAAELDQTAYQADLALISTYLSRKELDKALAAVQALEKKQPNNPLTFHMYGLVHAARRDEAEARKSFERALELRPGYVVAAYNLAVLDIAAKKPEDARKRFEALIAKDPANPQLYLEMARVQSMAGAGPGEVSATLQRAVAANPQSSIARVALIDLYRRAGDAKAALRAAQEAVAALPSDPAVLAAVAATHEAAGDLNQALDIYKRLAGVQSSSVQPLLRIAALHLRLKEPDPAIEALRKALRMVPSERDAVPPLVQAYLMTGKTDEALREARDLQRREPKFAGGFSVEGDIHLLQGKFAEAEKAYRQALRLEPRSTPVAVRLIGAVAAAGRPAEAESIGRKWLAENPKDAAMHMYLADRELAQKRLKQAVSHYEAVVRIEPQNVVALNNLAWIAGQLGDPKALAYAERAAKLAPNSATVLDTYGMLLVKQGALDKALPILEQAREIEPKRHELRVNFAKALIKAGRKEEARRELEALSAVKEPFAGKDEVDGLLKSL